MNQFRFFKVAGAFLMFVLLISSCTDDGSGNQVVKPKLDFVSGTGILTSDATIKAGEEFTVNLTGNQGDNPMSTLVISEAGGKLALDRINIAGLTSFGNPISLNNDLRKSFDFKISIKAHSDISTKAYSFLVTDDNGFASEKIINITTLGNPLSIKEPTGNLMASVAANGLFAAGFKVVKGASDIKSMEILINDIRATDVSSIYYGQTQTPVDANPYAIPAADKESLNKDLYFKAPSTTGTYKYTVKFIDAAGLSDSRDITVSVGTPVSMLVGILLNQSGPSGQGGLDLDTGASTGTVDSDPSTANGKIRDEGIVNIVSDQTWKQQISGMNGSEIKYIIKGTNGISENFKFENVKYKEEIAGLWTNGVTFTKNSTDGQRKVSDKVAVGDIFIVKNGTKYYLITVKDIKITTTDNKDNYTFDIKL
jgi:hypothetical protein